MFDTVLGLPVHVLVIHGVVVLLPLMSLVSIAVALRGRWRATGAWWVAGLDAVVYGMTLVAKQSGESLQRSLGGQVAKDHGDMGAIVPWFALALLVTSAAVALTKGNARLRPAAVGLLVVAGAAATYWTVRTGHSGAVAVWGSR